MMRAFFSIVAIAAYSIITLSCTGSEQAKKSDTVSKTIDISEWDQKRVDHPGTILDVRTQDEFNSGAVPGALLIDWYSTSFNVEVGKLDKEKPVYVYCHSGGRSQQAMNRMSQLGFKEVYNLKGGMSAWKRAHP